jgi:hypothetical protein
MKSEFLSLAILVTSSLFATSCASVSNLPPSASAVDWTAQVGDTGWAAYEDQFSVSAESSSAIYHAARSALATHGFVFKRGDVTEGFAIGEHGATLTDWNTLAAFYFRPSTEETSRFDVRLIIDGSKDLGFTGDNMETDYLNILTSTFLGNLADVVDAGSNPSASEQLSENPCIATAQTLIANGLTEEAATVLNSCQK